MIDDIGDEEREYGLEEDCPCNDCDQYGDAWCHLECFQWHDWLGYEDDGWDPWDI